MIIDFNRININEREEMMGGDRINDVEFNTNQMKGKNIARTRQGRRMERKHQSIWQNGIYSHLQKSCAKKYMRKYPRKYGEMEKSEKPHR